MLYPFGASVSINVYVPAFSPDIVIFPFASDVNFVASSFVATTPENTPFSSNVAYVPSSSNFNTNFAPGNVDPAVFFFVKSILYV